MTRSNESSKPKATQPAQTNGTGSCRTPGCGCSQFVAPLGSPGSNHCIGVNAAGGTCNHLKSDHN